MVDTAVPECHHGPGLVAHLGPSSLRCGFSPGASLLSQVVPEVLIIQMSTLLPGVTSIIQEENKRKGNKRRVRTDRGTS